MDGLDPHLDDQRRVLRHHVHHRLGGADHAAERVDGRAVDDARRRRAQVEPGDLVLERGASRAARSRGTRVRAARRSPPRAASRSAARARSRARRPCRGSRRATPRPGPAVPAAAPARAAAEQPGHLGQALAHQLLLGGDLLADQRDLVVVEAASASRPSFCLAIWVCCSRSCAASSAWSLRRASNCCCCAAHQVAISGSASARRQLGMESDGVEPVALGV